MRAQRPPVMSLIAEAPHSGGVIWSEVVFDSCLGLGYEAIQVSNQSGGDYLSLTGS